VLAEPPQKFCCPVKVGQAIVGLPCRASISWRFISILRGKGYTVIAVSARLTKILQDGKVGQADIDLPCKTGIGQMFVNILRLAKMGQANGSFLMQNWCWPSSTNIQHPCKNGSGRSTITMQDWY